MVALQTTIHIGLAAYNPWLPIRHRQTT